MGALYVNEERYSAIAIMLVWRAGLNLPATNSLDMKVPMVLMFLGADEIQSLIDGLDKNRINKHITDKQQRLTAFSNSHKNNLGRSKSLPQLTNKKEKTMRKLKRYDEMKFEIAAMPIKLSAKDKNLVALFWLLEIVLMQ